MDPLDLLGDAWGWLGAQLRFLGAAWRDQRAVKVFSLILLAALGLRLMRPEWYSHRTFHPDERWIFDRTAELSYPAEPGRNDPAGMQYGSLPLYTVALVKDALVHTTHLSTYDASILAGRTVTGLVDTLSVVGTFLLGLALLGAWPAVLASLLIACAPLHIQLAHFFTVDPWLTAMVTLTLAAAAQAAKRPGLKLSVLTGALYGLALASKTSGLPLVLGIVIAHLWGPLTPGLPAKERSRRLNQAFKLLGAAALATVAAFFVAMPWAFLDFSKFVANQTAQRDILVTGSPTGVPFVRQYWDTTPWFHLKNIAVYYLGLPVGPLALLAALLGLGAGLWGAWRAWALPAAKAGRRPGPESPAARWQMAFAPLLLLAWVLPYFAIVGFSFAKFARYMLPLLPELALLLAGLVAWLTLRSRALGLGLAALLAVAAIGHGVG
ncbi:MAG TPA: glycosyltransferase family 39 protein, partial [bacterium]|nr:glycosyltransferase family 39 protein [bacterium]